MDDILTNLTPLQSNPAGRFSSWDTSGRNDDAWILEPGEIRVLTAIDGPACITRF